MEARASADAERSPAPVSTPLKIRTRRSSVCQFWFGVVFAGSVTRRDYPLTAPSLVCGRRTETSGNLPHHLLASPPSANTRLGGGPCLVLGATPSRSYMGWSFRPTGLWPHHRLEESHGPSSRRTSRYNTQDPSNRGRASNIGATIQSALEPQMPARPGASFEVIFLKSARVRRPSSRRTLNAVSNSFREL